jgi:hypothetical protein
LGAHEDRSARLCAALNEPGFRELVDGLGGTGLLDRIVTALGGGDDTRLAEDSAALEELLEHAGLDGLNEVYRDFRPVPGAPGHPIVEVWACPTRRCSRVVADRAGERPWCVPAKASLRPFRLPT